MLKHGINLQKPCKSTCEQYLREALDHLCNLNILENL